MTEVALLTTALLFGGMVLYSFGFAAFVFNALPVETAGPLIRRAFPQFYLFVFGTSAAAAAVAAFSSDWLSASLLAVIALTTVFTRKVLMPATRKVSISASRRLPTSSGPAPRCWSARRDEAAVRILR